MTRMKLTKKIDEFKAFLWDGTYESWRDFLNINTPIVDFHGIAFHETCNNRYLTYYDHFTGAEKRWNPHEVFTLTDKGVKVQKMSELEKAFDVSYCKDLGEKI